MDQIKIQLPMVLLILVAPVFIENCADLYKLNHPENKQ